jgi:hypothetical protein
MECLSLEHKLRDLFLGYGPVQVMVSWNKVLSEFRQALQLYDTKPTTLVLKDVVEPVTKNPIEIPKPQAQKLMASPPSDKDVQKDKMRLHKEAILKKRQDLAAQGIIPETQLTDENLRKWIQTEKKTYWMIAELTGCNDIDISAKAKALDILSDVAKYIRHKRRTQI